jgi:heme ABC exporter ATP-binding subunit CcmA
MPTNDDDGRESVIHLRAAVALVGRFPVLAGVDLDVSAGQIVLLQGANGAGKTSLLRACAGLLRIVAGEARVLGVDMIEDPRAIRRRVGLLGHASALYDDLSVVDNVRFAVRAGGGHADRIDPALVALGLTGRLRQTTVGSLSAGQRRRVAFASLVAADPELWLLDEPHAGLDAEHRDLLDDLVRNAVGKGATVVLASHEAERAQGLADRIVTVAGGVVLHPERPGSERPLLERPLLERPAPEHPTPEELAAGRPAPELPAGTRVA